MIERLPVMRKRKRKRKIQNRQGKDEKSWVSRASLRHCFIAADEFKKREGKEMDKMLP